MEQPKIDVTITATLRPELFRRTLDSFFENCFRDWPVRAVMNVDPVGGHPSAVDEMSKLCRKYFPESFVILSDKPHFGRAFYKVWSMAGTDAPFVFHLEDDWELVRPVSLMHMVELFSVNEALSILRLPQNKAPMTGDYKDWNLLYPFNGQFYEVPANLRGTIGFCGHPSLIRTSFVRRGLAFLDRELNPEKQLKGIDAARRHWLQSCRLGVFTKPGNDRAIVDIGRKWRQDQKIVKVGPEAVFTTWAYG